MRFTCLLAILFAALATPQLYANENLSYACDSPPAFSFDMAIQIPDMAVFGTELTRTPDLPAYRHNLRWSEYLAITQDVYTTHAVVSKKSKRWWLMDSYLHTLLNPLPI